jgi:predicted Zn-dependent protease with MMP-like domain
LSCGKTAIRGYSRQFGCHLGNPREYDLLGLFQGIGLPFRSVNIPMQMPSMIWLYRRPILDYWAEHEETLYAVITHVLVHKSDTISGCQTKICRR